MELFVLKMQWILNVKFVEAFKFPVFRCITLLHRYYYSLIHFFYLVTQRVTMLWYVTISIFAL